MVDRSEIDEVVRIIDACMKVELCIANKLCSSRAVVTGGQHRVGLVR